MLIDCQMEYVDGGVPLSGIGSAVDEIDRLLSEAGTDKTRILSATIYLAEMSDYAAMNAVWDKWIDPSDPPARATIGAWLRPM